MIFVMHRKSQGFLFHAAKKQNNKKETVDLTLLENSAGNENLSVLILNILSQQKCRAEQPLQSIKGDVILQTSLKWTLQDWLSDEIKPFSDRDREKLFVGKFQEVWWDCTWCGYFWRERRESSVREYKTANYISDHLWLDCAACLHNCNLHQFFTASVKTQTCPFLPPSFWCLWTFMCLWHILGV